LIDDLDTILAELKAGIDLVDVVSDTVRLRRAGPSRWVGLCPFHAESDGSLSVNRKKQLFYCHGCQTGGDAITWVRELEGLAFWPALRQLADRIGMELPSPIRGAVPVPPLELTDLPAAYRAQPYVLLVERDADMDGINSPFVRLQEPVLTVRQAIRLESLHSRACLVYTDEEAAMQSSRNAFSSCPTLMFHLHPAGDAEVKQVAFRYWPDDLWRRSEPAINVLIRHELACRGWVSGAASVLVLSPCRGLQSLLLKACAKTFASIAKEEEKKEGKTPNRLEAELLTRMSSEPCLPDVEEVVGTVTRSVSSPVWDPETETTGTYDGPLSIPLPGEDAMEL
jgi:hypothetical protein